MSDESTGQTEPLGPVARAEAALRETQQRLDFVLASSNLGTWEWDLITGQVTWSRSLEEMFGVVAGGIGAPFEASERLVHPDDRERLRQIVARVLESGTDWDAELQHLRADGTSGWLEVRGRVFRDESGRAVRMIGTTRDITERKRADKGIDRDVLILANVRDSVIVTDLDGVVTYWNKGATELFGWDESEMVGRSLLERFPEPERSGTARMVESIRNGGEFAGHWEDVRKDGSRVWIDARVRLLTDATGNPVGIMGISHDITPRKRHEAKLQQTQKLDSLAVLAGGIAHDFNNLLTGVLGYADLALMELPPAAPVRESVEQIARAGRRAAELSRQMLAYSGKGRFVVGPVHLSNFVEEMRPLLLSSVPARCVLSFDLFPDLPIMDADAAQLRQVITNLVTNAAESIGDRGGTVTVRTGARICDHTYLSEGYLAEEHPEGLYVFLEVSDTGTGMTEGVRARVFDPFFTTKFTGRGLGLAAVLGIVRGHGGAILVSSAPDRGSTFFVLFPASSRPVRADASRGPDTAAWKGRGTILIVDDEEIVREGAAKMLAWTGLTVLTAADGREGIGVFRQHAGDVRVVLLDLTMPHTSGEETFRELRRIRPDVAVILSSGYSEHDATARFAEEGLAGFLQKPYTYAELVNAVRAALESQTPS